DHAKPRVQVAVADEAPDGGRRAARAGAHDHPLGDGVELARHLAEDAFGDVVVAAPVGGALGVRELVQIIPVGLVGDGLGSTVDFAGVVDEMAAAAEALDGLDLLPAGRTGHHGHERQAEQAGEVGLRHGGGTGRSLDQERVLADAAIADAVQEQGTRQAVLEAAGGMRALVLEIDVDAAQPRKIRLHQVRVGRTAAIGLEDAYGPAGPVPVFRRQYAASLDAVIHVVAFPTRVTG